MCGGFIGKPGESSRRGHLSCWPSPARPRAGGIHSASCHFGIARRNPSDGVGPPALPRAVSRVYLAAIPDINLAVFESRPLSLSLKYDNAGARPTEMARNGARVERDSGHRGDRSRSRAREEGKSASGTFAPPPALPRSGFCRFYVCADDARASDQDCPLLPSPRLLLCLLRLPSAVLRSLFQNLGGRRLQAQSAPARRYEHLTMREKFANYSCGRRAPLQRLYIIIRGKLRGINVSLTTLVLEHCLIQTTLTVSPSALNILADCYIRMFYKQ